MKVQLAQYNTATLRRPLDDPASTTYVALLDEVNALAEASPGFVWRHGIDSRDESTSVYENPLTLVNMSVWETLGDLRDYAYKGFHRDVFRRRQEWFEASGAVMWWIPAGTIPTLAEGVVRLDFLRRHGPTPYGFQTGQRYPELVMVERGLTDDEVVAIVGDRPAAGADAMPSELGTAHVAVVEGRASGVAIAGGVSVRTWTAQDPMTGADANDWLVPALETHARLMTPA